MKMPRSREEIDALPYRLEYGHWGINAWSNKTGYDPGRLLASVQFPVTTRGPYDPPHVQDQCFTELDAAARKALAEMEESTCR